MCIKTRNILSCAILFAVILSCLCGCSNKVSDEDVLKYVSGELGIEIADAAVDQYVNDHFGFLGDGTTYITLRFSNEEFLEQIKDSDQWKKYPLPSSFDWIVKGEDSAPLWNRPESVENGYYYFKDRYLTDNDGSNDPDKVKERVSLNFTMAVYDTDKNKLFYYEIDT